MPSETELISSCHKHRRNKFPLRSFFLYAPKSVNICAHITIFHTSQTFKRVFSIFLRSFGLGASERHRDCMPVVHTVILLRKYFILLVYPLASPNNFLLKFCVFYFSMPHQQFRELFLYLHWGYYTFNKKHPHNNIASQQNDKFKMGKWIYIHPQIGNYIFIIKGDLIRLFYRTIGKSHRNCYRAG